MTPHPPPPSEVPAIRPQTPGWVIPVIAGLAVIALALGVVVITLARRPAKPIAAPAGSPTVPTVAPTTSAVPFPMHTMNAKDVAACKKAFDTSALGNLERMQALGEEATGSDIFDLHMAGDDLVTATELALSGGLSRDQRFKAFLLASSAHNHLMGECLLAGYKEA